MMNWAKQKLADVAGTREPIYGPSAIRSVAEQTATTPYTELGRDDFKWNELDSTNVETQVFYLLGENGYSGFVQIIYSNVAGLRTTCQFNTKIFYPKSQNKPPLWSSDQLSNVDISEDKTSFYADNLALELSPDFTTYTVKAMTNENSLCDLTIVRTAPAFHVGKDGKTLYGTDLENPWGLMHHAFWPRASLTGSIVTQDGPIDFKGQAMFIMALQGMKPHHAAATWRYANFQGPTYSAVMMEYTTPSSYGSTVVNVGGIAKDGEIICAGSSNTAEHTKIKGDSENGWPEPETAKFQWNGKTKDGKDVVAVVETPLGERLDRVDIMAEVPGFIKQIVAGAAGTKPYIYHWENKTTLKLNIGGEEITEEGDLFNEATFIVSPS